MTIGIHRYIKSEKSFESQENNDEASNAVDLHDLNIIPNIKTVEKLKEKYRSISTEELKGIYNNKNYIYEAKIAALQVISEREKTE